MVIVTPLRANKIFCGVRRARVNTFGLHSSKIVRRLSLGTKLTLGTALLIATAVASSAWYGMSTLDGYARASSEARRKDLEQGFQREADPCAFRRGRRDV